MAALTAPLARRLDDDATTRPVSDIARYLQEQVGQRVAAAVAGLADAKQIGLSMRSLTRDDWAFPAYRRV